MAIVDVHGSILHVNKQFKLQFANCKPLQGRSIEEFIASDSESQSSLIAKIAKIASTQSKWETSVITESGQKLDVVLSAQTISLNRAIFFIFRVKSKGCSENDSASLYLGTIVHELKNILSGIYGYCQLLSASNGKSYTEKLEKAIRGAISWNEKVLTSAMHNLLMYKDVDINAVALLAFELIRPVLRGNIEVELKLSPDKPTIMGDAFQIERAVINLILNAEQAMPDGGRITIETYTHNKNGYNYAVIAVSDTGAGISKDELQKVQQPYFTTKEGGSGVGLYLTSVIVKNHNGWINIAEVDIGAKFELVFPAKHF